jgi:hypothetical protein
MHTNRTRRHVQALVATALVAAAFTAGAAATQASSTDQALAGKAGGEQQKYLKIEFKDALVTTPTISQ